MENIYNPKQIEEPIYNFWEKSGYFEPNITLNNKKNNYCIMMPPPNITGGLHLGHAFQQTIMDILVRYNRMNGKNVLWSTGLDHAGIAAQILIENNFHNTVNSNKITDINNFLLKDIWEWKKKSEKFINYQMKRLGYSISWSNNRFTMDSDMSFSVKEAFIRLYKNNLIYRGKRLVNWDFKLKTAISDLEVSHKQIPGSIWYIRYKLEDHICSKINYNNSNYLVVATTRPETMLGDVAVAVNPQDYRYHKLIGKYVLIPIINRRIPIISDNSINIFKGTGCVKITPGHDFNDHIIGKKNTLSMINIFSNERKILEKPEIFDYIGQSHDQLNYHIPKQFHNLDCDQARKIILLECDKLNLLEDKKEYILNIPYNNRTGTIIEPMLTNQWYIRTQNLAKQAIHAVRIGSIEFIPKKYKNIYFQWMNNIQDWCISRQIWWGHQIPAWYDNNNIIYVGHSEEEIRKTYQLNNDIILKQDKDVLDTWFSSSLWTFSSLGWPKNTTLLNLFHPTNIIISGFDIIFFWISRMIMMTMYLIKDTFQNSHVPFKKIYITGLIRDEFGQKMSKSKGNVIDPLDMINGISIKRLLKKRIKKTHTLTLTKSIIKKTKKQFPNGIRSYGADSLRLTLAALTSSGRDIHWDISKLTGYHNFCNKLWHVSRFVLMHTTNQDCGINTKKEKLFSLSDRWIVSKLHQTIQNFYISLEYYRFDKIVNILYEFIWHQFCDWYIELTKPILYDDNIINTFKLRGTRYTLITSLETLLRLAHPIIPFITEKIWQKVRLIMKINSTSIMMESFPKYNINSIDCNAIIDLEYIKNIISEVRIIRTYIGIPYTTTLEIAFRTTSEHIKTCILENNYIFIKILKLKKIDFLEKNEIYNPRYLKIPLHKSDLIIFLPNTFNKKIAINRFLKEIESINYKINSIKQKIDNNHHQHSKILLTKELEKIKNYNKIKNKLIDQYSIIKTF